MAAHEGAQASVGELLSESVRIMARLRGPDGCPWDRAQTPETIRKYTVEETYEVLDAIERKDAPGLCEELGDLLLQVLFYAQMAAEAGQFSMGDVAAGLNRKLVRRHPHVFGPEASREAGNRALPSSAGGELTPDDVVQKWFQIKQFERKANVEGKQEPSRLATVLRAQPALLEAEKLGAAAAKCGFDWPDATGLLAKVREEIDEVEAELSRPAAIPEQLRMEIGDLLFVTANLARHAQIDAETALRDANAKFRRRFASMEQAEREDGGARLEARSLDELEALWQQAKQLERRPEPNEATKA